MYTFKPRRNKAKVILARRLVIGIMDIIAVAVGFRVSPEWGIAVAILLLIDEIRGVGLWERL